MKIFFAFLLFVSFTHSLYSQTGIGRLGEVQITLDRTFGMNGRVEADPGGFGGQVTSFLSGNGVPTIVSGILNTSAPGLFHIGMMECDTGGVLDLSFGKKGLANLSWSQSDYSNDMQIGSNGTGWFLAGSGSASGSMLPAVYQIKSDGNPDSTFGTNGRFVMPFSPGSTGEATNSHFFGTKYFVYGVSRAKSDGIGVSGFGMMGVNLNGTLDSTTGINGSFVIPAPVHSVQGFFGWKDGSMSLLCGISDTGKHEILLALFKINGRPDSSFGVNGLAHTGVFAAGDTIYSGLETPSDAPATRCTVILPAPDSSPTPLSICRLDTSGKPDTSYNHGSGISTNLIMPSFKPKGLTINKDLSQSISGMAHVGLGESVFVRCNDTTARPDSIFNGNGIAVIDVDNAIYTNYLKYNRPVGKLDQLGKIKRFIGVGGSIHNGLENFMIARFITSPIEGVSESDPAQENFSLYPNPSGSFFIVNTGVQQLKNIRIMDALGREVRIPFHSNNSGELTAYTCDVSKLPSGIYYCLMQTEKDLVARKFIKN